MLRTGLILLLIGLFSVSGIAQDETEVALDSLETKSPGRALLFSIIPGGGQLYNESPIKAVLFAGAFSYFALEYVRINNSYQDDNTNSDLHRSRNDQVWLMALTWVLNMGDAFVEAHLWDFGEYEVKDDALPDDEEVNTEEIDEQYGTE